MQIQALRSNRARQLVAKSGVIQAPTGGWDASSPLAAMPKDRAVELVNWFPQPGYIEVRKGHDEHATSVGSSTTPVETLMVWQGPSTSKMFGAASTIIYDVTTAGAGTSSLTGLTDAAWQWVSFTNAGNTYLYCVNGADDPRHYNGSSWATPSLTGTTASDLIHINVHKKRIWFIQKDSMNAWYLATDAISGALTQFALGSTFSRGGYLVAMTTWTRDGGAGADDFAIFISSRGQIAIYQGTDPANANTWALVGLFDAPAPIGRRCFARWGADVLLNTVEGVYPLSQVLSVDQSQARGVALTKNIQNAFVQAARMYRTNEGWETCVYNKGTMLLVNIPTSEFATQRQYVMNTLTGAWCSFEGMNATTWCVFNDDLYFGGNDGTVYQADVGSADLTDPIVAVGQCSYDSFSNPGRLKRFTMLQPLVTSSDANRPALGISTDFVETSELSQSSVTASSGIALFDVSLWDSSDFAGSVQSYNDWISIPALGRFASVKFQATTGIIDTTTVTSPWGTALWGGTYPVDTEAELLLGEEIGFAVDFTDDSVIVLEEAVEYGLTDEELEAAGGASTWGAEPTDSDQTMQINGFVVLYESGDYV